MRYLVSASTDIGIKKNTNQDSLAVKVAKTCIGEVTFVVLCDGMGGLEQGEVASSNLVREFSDWFAERFPQMLSTGALDDYLIRQEWEKIILESNQKIMNYGREHQINLGTTVVAGLFTDKRYYIINVGDSRAYEIDNIVRVITTDQTVVEREVQKGIITKEQAKTDPRRSVLLQCVGASIKVFPEMFFGYIKQNSTYMFCSDGFRHVISDEEIYTYFSPSVLLDKDIMKNNSEYLIELNKNRKEEDNISVVLIRTY